MSSRRRDRRRLFVLGIVSALATAGCGGAPPPAPASPEASATPAATGGAATPSPTAGGASGGAPTGTVLGVAVSDKGDHYTRVTVSFKNPSSEPCRIPSYTLIWEGGTKDIPLDDFVLPPGQSQTRAVRVHAGEGDITRLTDAASTRVDVHASCGKR